MQDILGSVRRSLVFRTPPDNEEGASTLVDKMNSFIRKSRVFSKPSSPTLLPPLHKEDPADDAPPIRWRKGELIGCGAFGRVYMGMNLDSGELLAVKQVLIAAHSASNEKAQAHIRELEEEVNLLKNLSHPNIVRYLGTVREEESLNILLEFVPGGSISSLLGKFGPFPEPVIKTYTKQLLFGLEYLHKHGIMHRDIKGANILVDNKGCIKLADFGASKQVVELATVTGAKSLKGTPYWMAPEVVHQTGHNISADIWSVGCTVIEMATGKPPWSDQYQGVAVLFHIGNSESLPPIPEHMSVAAKDFLLKCLQREPNMRPSACELLQHPFVTGERAKPHPGLQTSFMENPETPSPSNAANLRAIQMTSCNGSADLCNLGSLSCSTVFPVKLSESKHVWGANDVDGEMCQIDDNDDFMVSDVKLNSVVRDDFNKSFNPMCEPFDDWGCSPNGDLESEHRGMNLDTDQADPVPTVCSSAFEDGDSVFSFSCGPSISEDDDELTESKITAFLDEKALELKKLQTPLYEEFYNSLNTICSPAPEETTSNFLKLPPKSRSPSRGPMGTSPSAVEQFGTASPGSNNRRVSNVGSPSNQMSQDTPSSVQHNDRKGVVADAQQESSSTSVSFSEIQRKWKEELDQELERKREMMRQAGVGGKTSSPKDRPPNRPKTRFASPGK